MEFPCPSEQKHDVPTAAIPCLHQLNALKESGHGKAQKEHTNDAILSNFVTSSNDCRSSGQDDEAGKTGYYGNSNQCGNHGDETKQDRCQDNCDVFCRHDSYAGSSESQPCHNVSKDLDSALNPSKHCHDLNKLDCKISSPNILGDDLGIDCRSDCNLSSNNDPGDIYTNFENSDDNFHNDCNYSDHNSFNHIDNHESDINHMKGSQSCKNDTYSQTSENVTGQDKSKHSKNLFQIGSGEVEMTTTSELSDYLSKLWEFQRITEEEEKMPLLNPRDNKTPKDGEENGLADVLKTIPYLVQGCDPNIKSKDNLINPAGKSPQSLLHEYCTRFLKLKPAYNTVESGNSKAPFLATVEINGLQYGTGIGASKKQARHIAAQATLDILVPGTYEKVPDVGQHLEVGYLKSG